LIVMACGGVFPLPREVSRMAQSFGARMRERREKEQVSLIAIAEQTKIKLSLLDALERDDVTHWPSGIFRRAFIRAYAHAIGLEPDIVVREFLELYPDPVETVTPIPAFEATATNTPERPAPLRVRFLVGSAVDAVSRTWQDLGRKRRMAPADVPASTPGEAMAQPPPFKPDLLAAAHLCTELGRVFERRDAAPLLQRAARLLDAVGLIVWAWDQQGAELVPTLAHGYSDEVLAQLPQVRRDTDNATAAAFRSTQTCVVKSCAVESGALVVPLMTPGGCVGVFAVELQRGAEQLESVRALATIFAAQLAILIGTPRLPQAVNA
jgi:transcriptional regulator with XRE-family HTH domain